MFRKALYAIGSGTFCQAIADGDGTLVHTRENGRIVRRLLLPGGKAVGVRPASYADTFFAFPFATVEVFGEEVMYDKTGNDSRGATQSGTGGHNKEE